MKNAFEEALGEEISVPQNFKVMGAIGAAILAKENIEKNNTSTKFNGFDLTDIDFVSKSFECTGCPNRCEVVKILGSKKIIGFFGGRCERWNKTISA
jgi:hypothetical protein